MKATVREHVPGSRLAAADRDAVIKSVEPPGVHTLVPCEHNPRDVNLSVQLLRAFRRVGPLLKERTIIVGAAFTEEAKALAAERGAVIVALHKTVWTDESARQRQL